MKKIRLGVIAGMMALLVAVFSANTVAIAEETAATKNNVVIADENWDGTTAADPVVLNNVTAKELIVESGNDSVLKINGGTIETVSVVAPKLDEINYEKMVKLLELGIPVEEVVEMYQNYQTEKKEASAMKPTIKVDGDAVIDEMVVSGGATLNLDGGEVKEVVVNNNNKQDRLTITIQNYDGKVRVDQEKNADGTSNLLTIKLKNSNLSELNVSGENNCYFTIDGDKNSDVAALNVNGAADVTVNVDAKDILLAEGAEKSAVRVYANVENVVVEADNCEFSVAASAKVTNAKVDGDNVQVRYTGTLENSEINGKGSEVKYAKITPPPAPTSAPRPTATPKPTEIPKPEGTIIGNEDCSTGWWTAHSDVVKVEEGTTETVTFYNYTNKLQNWNNFVVVLQNVPDAHSAADNASYEEYAVVRADNYGWGNGYGSATLESNWNWTSFTGDMDGAKVDLAITNNGTTVDVVANITTQKGKEFIQKYTGISVWGDVYYCLSIEGGYLIIPEADTPETEEPEVTPDPTPEVTPEPEDPEVTPEVTPEPENKNIVGDVNFGTAFFGAHSETVKIEEGTARKVTFKNYTNGAANWNNYVVVLQNIPDVHSAEADAAYKEYGVLRADNFGWGTGYGAATLDTNASADWAAWLADMNGATVEVVISNHGTTADVVANITAENGNTYYQKYMGVAVDGDLYYCLTVDGSYLEILETDEVELPETEEPEPTPEVTPEPTPEVTPEPEETIIGNTDLTTLWWTAFSDVVKVEEGETKTVTFKNYSNEVNNWNNFVVILQNVATGHSATDTAGYKEYAVVRPDNYGWGEGFGTAVPESNWNWDTFKSDMNGATVVVSITNNGTTADVVADITTKDGATHFQKYSGITIDGELYYCLSVQEGYLVLE